MIIFFNNSILHSLSMKDISGSIQYFNFSELLFIFEQNETQNHIFFKKKILLLSIWILFLLNIFNLPIYLHLLYL